MPDDSQEQRAQLKPGMLKKGGINDRPTEAKPQVTPGAQEPTPQSDAPETSAAPSPDLAAESASSGGT